MRIYKLLSKGFTFIELMVVISIIGILVSAGIVSYTSVNKRSRDATRRSDLEQIRSALEMYRADNGSYVRQSCTDITCSPMNVKDDVLTDLTNYLSKYPTDPISGYYKYRPINWSSSKPYGYCLYANIEQGTADLTDCDAISGYNYEVKNP